MGEYVILVPEQYNDGQPVGDLTRGMIEDAAIGLFGGFTAYPTVKGAWRDDATGTVYRDNLTPLHLACSDSGKVRAFARTVGSMLDQLAVYVRNPDGSVEFVSQA